MQLPHTEVRKCLNPSCALMFAFPQLDDLALGAAYQKFYYPASDTGIAAYQNTPEQILRQTFDKAAAELGPLAGKRLLDFGCGVGRLCRVASDYGIRAVGIEPDANAREHARKSSGLRAYASLRDLRAARPYSKFDIVTMWDVVEHLREPWKELEDLLQALRPGGWLMLSTPNAASLRARVERQRWENVVNRTHFYYFTRKSLEAVLRRAGFSEITELRFPIRYPGHATVRQLVHRALVSCRLQGQLVFVAEAVSTHD
jgi:SAM-dependent methyltransferase